MTKRQDVHFSKDFEKSLEEFYPCTNPKEFNEYMKKRISEVIEKINSVENGIRLRRVHFDVDPCCLKIRINLDRASRENYEIAYLEVSPKIVDPVLSVECKNLVKLLESKKSELKGLEFDVSNSRLETALSCHNLIHEFGHLQDAQREEFGYTGECKHLHYYIEVIWNVLLDGRLLDTYKMSSSSKELNWREYHDKLKARGVYSGINEFEYLWEKKDYCYPEIRNLAQSYFDNSKSNNN